MNDPRKVVPIVEQYTWTVPCTLTRRRDGDTFEVLAQVPGRVEILMLGMMAEVAFPMPFVVRLEGVDAPERNTAEGKATIAWVDEWFARHNQHINPQLYLATNMKKDNFGRTLGDIRLSPSYLTGLAHDLLMAGRAVPYERELHGYW